MDVTAPRNDRDVGDLVPLETLPVAHREPQQLVVELECAVEVGDPDRHVVEIDDVDSHSGGGGATGLAVRWTSPRFPLVVRLLRGTAVSPE